jgi:hypothetical protein
LLRVEGGALTIRNGFTHYPQKQETYRFFKGELTTTPPRIIVLDGNGSISFDVLTWLSDCCPPVRIRFRAIAFHILLFVSMFVTGVVQATDLPLGGGLAGALSGGNALAILSLEFMSSLAIGSTRSA